MCRRALFLIFLFVCYVKVESKVNGGWGSWSEWSGWAKGLCAGNQRVKTRPCTNPSPSSDGDYCVGDNAVNQPGPVDGGWTDWSQWSTCARPCGGSKVNRTRTCTNPEPKNNGAQCNGHNIEHKIECVAQCPEGRVDGNWSPWGAFSPCPKQCSQTGGSVVTRTRQCNMPPPMNGGSACQGPSVETITACFNKCPRHGGFGSWSGYSGCSKTCGSGVQVRQRLCNNPEPAGPGAKNCTGVFTQSKYCKIKDCAGFVDGNWSPWKPWTKCSESTYCLKGETKRTRSCTNPAPSNGGDACLGSSEEIKLCPRTNCQDLRPTVAPIVPALAGSYIARECGVTQKYTAAGAHGKKVPAEVYNHLKFKKSNFQNGYFAMQTEEKGEITKFCFEPYPQISIKDVTDNLITSYPKTDPIRGYTKPKDNTQPILGFSIRIKKDKSVKGYDFGLEFADKFSPGQGIWLSNVMFTYYTEGSYWSFLAKGDYTKFAPTIFKTVIFRNATGTTSMLGNAEKMKFQHFFNALGITSIPSAAISAMKAIKLWDLELDKLSIAFDCKGAWEQRNSPFRFSATKYVGGIPLHFETVMILHKANFQIAFGFIFDGESFGAVVDKMSGINKGVGGFLESIGLQIEVGIMFNPFDPIRTTKGITAFSKEPLKEITKKKIEDGLLVAAQVSLPKDCRSSSFCKVTKTIIGPKANFRIQGLIKKNYYKLTAGFYKIKLAENVYFQKLEMYLEVKINGSKKESTIGFKAEVKIALNQGEVTVDGIPMEKPEIRVGGIIKHKLGTKDIEGTLYMRGMWRKAFGIEWFAIGNIVLGVTIKVGTPTVVTPTGFQFGGQLEFGRNCLYDADYKVDGHCLSIKIYFGYGKPSFFYGEITALTIGKLIRMFGGKETSVPGIVAESGFPEGAKVSYSPDKEVDLTPMGGPLIRKGLEVKGRLNLLGYEIYAHVRYSEDEIYIEGEMDPINLGGFVKVSRSKTMISKGPRLVFHYRSGKSFLIPIPYFKAYFEGYAHFFGIEAYAYINITMSALEIYVYGKAWNLIYAELYISAGYNIAKIKDMHFYVRVIVDLRGLTDAIEKARKAVDGAFKAAQKTLNDAIEKVKGAKRKCKETLQLKCKNCYSLKCKEAEENCKGFLDKAGKWIGGVINAAGRWIKNTARKIRDGLAYVGRKIKKFFSGWRRRRSLINGRNENFDLHVRNRRFISKLICEGLVGGGCRGVEHLCYGSCKAVNFIGQGLCSILDVAVAALRVAEAACGWINAAIQFLLQMFLIHGIRFELGLGHKFGGGFMVAAEIDLTLFGQRMNFGFRFDLQNPFRSITSAKDSGLYTYKEGVKQQTGRTIFDPYDPPNPFSDFDLTGSFGVESTQTGDGLRLGSCIATVNKDAGSKLVLAGCNQTDTRQQWTFTLKGSLMNAYSKKCVDVADTNGAFVVQRDCKDSSISQKLECDIVTRTLKRRRSVKCITAAKSSPLGPGSLVHLGSLKCIQTDPQNRLVLRGAGCQSANTEFHVNSNGHLIHKKSGYCVRPAAGRVAKGAPLELTVNGKGCHSFGFTQKGSLQHKSSRYCVQTAGKEMKPRDYTALVIGERCENVKSTATVPAFPDPQMVFSFVPTDQYLKIQDCGYFDDAKLEQRFEVMNDELASVCSKRAIDVALHKSAVQSSTDHNGFASRAVDGNYKFSWKDGSCTHTKNERNPWWRVDLGREYIVTDITVINRGEYGDRFKNVEVRVGNLLGQFGKNPICHDRVKQAQNGEAVRLQCNPPIPGRYVSVQMIGQGILTVCEVIVNSRVGGLADWCLLDNGGCAQICNNQCGRKTSCSCLPGYKLAYDGKACIDIDECQSNFGGCRLDKKAKCVNYPGGYYCGCTAGYILKDNSKTECVDFNECGVGNGGCEQMCNNTIGGYLCTCRKGYERKKDTLYGCQDINECATNKGGCQHTCENYEGGYLCACNPGFRLAEDGKSCEEIYCNVLEKPHWGAISPALCTQRYANIPIATSCQFSCTKGYEIAASKTKDTLTCRIDGTWNHGSPSCHPVKCPALTRPANGGIVPANCHVGAREFGQRCVSYCKHGYRLRGAATRYCQSDKSWSADSSVQCIKIFDTPYLNCPADIMVTLPDDKGRVALGGRFPIPQTNMNITSVSPLGAGPQYEFPAGTNIIKFSAISDDGEVTKSCDIIVDVIDFTRPKVSNCPADILKRTYQSYEVITWTEPTFTDNVGIQRLEKAHIQPGQSWSVGESVALQYRALDKAGNEVKCNFRVTVKSLNCPPMTGDKYTTITEFVKGKSYNVGCQWGSGRTLFGPYGTMGGPAFCSNGDYTMAQKTIGHQAPHCVLFKASTQTARCVNGTQKFEAIDFFGGKTYYCANCPPGTSHNAVTGKCDPCRLGTYQGEEGKLDCYLCNITQTTLKTGSKSESDCVDKCLAGYYSPNGLNIPKAPCKVCPKGTYSYLYGSTECKVCPDGTSTISTGATDKTHCQGQPKITDYEPKAKKTVKLAEVMVLECFYSATNPTATWKKITGAATTGIQTDIYNLQSEKVGVALAIFGATAADTGMYECSVSNQLGRDYRRVELEVK